VIGFTLLFSIFLACLVTFTLGLSRYLDYRDQVLTCVEDKIGNQQHYLANSVSSKNEEFLLVVLKRVEERCDFTQHDYLGLVLHHEDDERVDFFWVVSDREDEWLRVGKDLLVGPEISRLYPLSSWPEYGKGEYWLGDIRGTFYFGGYLELSECLFENSNRPDTVSLLVREWRTIDRVHYLHAQSANIWSKHKNQKFNTEVARTIRRGPK
jgi:hypothetical protein